MRASTTSRRLIIDKNEKHELDRVHDEIYIKKQNHLLKSRNMKAPSESIMSVPMDYKAAVTNLMHHRAKVQENEDLKLKLEMKRLTLLRQQDPFGIGYKLKKPLVITKSELKNDEILNHLFKGKSTSPKRLSRKSKKFHSLDSSSSDEAATIIYKRRTRRVGYIWDPRK